MTLASAVLASGVVAVGALSQGTVGFGVGTIAAPLLLLIDPRLVPGPLLATAFCLILALTGREWRGIRFAYLAWSLVGRFAGTVAAALFIRGISQARFETALGIVVILGALISAVGLEVRLTRAGFLGAGALSGFFGTTAAIGGPPIALLYQRESGQVVRGTLSAFFVVGTAISIGGLAWAGKFGPTELRLTPVLLPGALVGFLLSGRLTRLMDRGWLRPAILVLSLLAGCIVVLKHLL
ncbi:MAG TPA: sulfite exporter TauE/SafE family protein [Gemmatimonadales bacterium]|nr:sulfite exporter TauE/SafE family protein [Gemmatimonadales bacterium]